MLNIPSLTWFFRQHMTFSHLRAAFEVLEDSLKKETAIGRLNEVYTSKLLVTGLFAEKTPGAVGFESATARM